MKNLILILVVVCLLGGCNKKSILLRVIDESTELGCDLKSVAVDEDRSKFKLECK